MNAINELLYEAAEEGDLAKLEAALLAGKVDVNFQNKKVFTFQDCRGCTFNYGTFNTALHVAVRVGAVRIVAKLIEAGANVNIKNNDVWAPIFLSKTREVAEILLNAGANIEARSRLQSTPLHTAACTNATEVVRILLERGADHHCIDYAGKTPLHCACLYGNVDIIRLLLHAGADVHALNTKGESPLYMAQQYGEFSSCDLKDIEDTIDRWPVTMTIVCLKELVVFHYVDLSMIDLWEFVGQEKDFT